MAQKTSNIIIGILVILIIFGIIYWISNNDDQPYYEGFNNNIVNFANRLGESKTSKKLPNLTRPVRPEMLDNRKFDEISDSLVDDIVSQYTVESRPMEGGTGSFSPKDPMSETHGCFSDYGRKKHLKMKRMEQAYYEDDYDPRDFSYKKKRFSKRTPEDIRQQFDIDKVLPQEIEEDWFDVEPLLTTKKIKGTHLLHPKVHMGVNTVGSSLRNGTHDLRGDIPNPKINVSPWNNSTIEPDTNLKGICNPI
jgi:hypothetical protein